MRTFYNTDSIQSKREDVFIADINNREKISKTLNTYVAALDKADKKLLILSGVCCVSSFWSFATIIGTPTGIASASIGLVIFIDNEIIKTFLKTMWTKKISIE